MKLLDDLYLILLPACAIFGPLMMVTSGGPGSHSSFVGAFMTGIGVILLTFKIKSLQKQVNELKGNK